MSTFRPERFFRGVLAVVLTVVASSSATSCHSRASAPLPVTLITLEQIQSRLADDKAAGRVAVMHLWATWCGPCVEEFPRLAKFYRDSLASDKSVDFFAVAVDDPGDKNGVVKFITDAGATFPVFIADTPDQAAFSRGINPAWPSVLPTTFLYGLDGLTKDVHMGEITNGAAFRKSIEAAKKK